MVRFQVAYDNDDPYRKYMRNDFMLTQGFPSAARILRFTIDLAAQQATYNNIVPEVLFINHAHRYR